MSSFLYFRTKEEIYLALLAEGLARWTQAVKDALTAKLPSLEAVLKRYTGFCVQNPSYEPSPAA